MSAFDSDIMIVDDDEDSLLLLTGILTAAGHEVRPAGSGALALRSIRAKPPALVLLDIRMPGMDGYEVGKALKSEASTRDIPIIFISVADEPWDKARGFEAGCVDYIAKPFDQAEVLARVKTHLELHRAQVELRRRSDALEAQVEERTAQLKREIERCTKSAEALARLVEEKKTLMRELQHRAKNSLNSVIALLAIEAKGLKDQHSRDIFKSMEARILSMSAIYEQLSGEGGIDRVKLDAYLARLVSKIVDSYLPPGSLISIRTDLADAELDTARSVTMGLIVTELLVNSIKYAFEPGLRGEIGVELRAGPDGLVLRVFDDGAGIALRKADGEGTGMGLRLVEMLVEQLDGKLSMRRDHGTEFAISLSLCPPPQEPATIAWPKSP